MHSSIKRLVELLREIKVLRPNSRWVDLAAAMEETPHVIGNWKTRGVSVDGANKAQRLYGINTNFIQLGEGDKFIFEKISTSIGAHHENIRYHDENLIIICQYETGGAMGHGVELRDQPGVIQKWVVNHEWLQKNVKNFSAIDKLCIVTGFGDSMKGIYNPGDPLIVDTGVNSVDYDAIFFFRIGNEGFIKRLQRIPGRGIVAISENKAYQDWVIDGNMDFEVFGRVLKAWKSEDF